MPVLTVSTNAALWDDVLCSRLAGKLSQEVSRIMNKPESYVMVLVNAGVPLLFDGTEELGAYAELVSIGGLTPQILENLCRGISSLLESELSVSRSRCYIKFLDTKEESRGEADQASCFHALHQ